MQRSSIHLRTFSMDSISARIAGQPLAAGAPEARLHRAGVVELLPAVTGEHFRRELAAGDAASAAPRATRRPAELLSSDCGLIGARSDFGTGRGFGASME